MWSDNDGESRQSTKMRLVGEDLERRTYTYEARLASPLGIKLSQEPLLDGDSRSNVGRATTRVVVCDVMPGGSAAEAGVRPGDRIVATGASWGGGMWESSTVDGVTSSVATKVRMFGEVRLRFERPFDGADEVTWRSVVSESFTVELEKPLGITLEERGTGEERGVFVKAVNPGGNAQASGKVAPGG